MQLKFLQWNILYKENPDAIIETLVKIDADILCLQELTTNSSFNPKLDIPSKISKHLGLSYYFAKAQEWNIIEKRILGEGIFSKFPLENTLHTYLNPPSHEPTDFGTEGRVFVEAGVDINGKKLTVATTHLSYSHKFENTPQRKKEFSVLLDILRKKKDKFIFSGDLNAAPNSEGIQSINRILKSCGPDYKEKTFTHKYFEMEGFIVNDLDYRIDYVFATPDIKILKSEIPHVQPSDHLPILVEFEI